MDHPRKNQKLMVTMTPAALADLATIAAQDCHPGEVENLSRAVRTALRESVEGREKATRKIQT